MDLGLQAETSSSQTLVNQPTETNGFLSLQQSVFRALAAAGVTVTSAGAVFTDGVLDRTIWQQAMGAMLSADSGMRRSMNFVIGDFYNKARQDFADEAEGLLDACLADYTASTIRGYGAVAAKFPIDKRVGNLNWSGFKILAHAEVTDAERFKLVKKYAEGNIPGQQIKAQLGQLAKPIPKRTPEPSPAWTGGGEFGGHADAEEVKAANERVDHELLSALNDDDPFADVRDPSTLSDVKVSALSDDDDDGIFDELPTSALQDKESEIPPGYRSALIDEESDWILEKVTESRASAGILDVLEGDIIKEALRYWADVYYPDI